MGCQRALKHFFKSSAFKIILGIVLIILGVLLYTSINQNGNIFSNAISFVTKPAQKALWYVSNSTFDFAYQLQEKEKLLEENESLKKQLSDLRNITVDYYDVKRENAKLMKYYDLKKSNTSLKFVSAAVVGKDPTEFFGDFVIDKGSSSGISVNDLILTENGVVGRVSQINSHLSRVRTILSPDSKIGVINVRTGETGVISGEIMLSAKNLTRMIFISSQNRVQPGDIIVTSGTSGMYPKNMKLGKVVSVDYDSHDSSYYAVIEPFEKVKEVTDVFVITDFQGKGQFNFSPN